VSEPEEDLKLDWFSRFVLGHPNFGFGFMMVVVDIYLVFQAWPMFSDKDSRWVGLIFMVPMIVLANALAIMLMKLMGAMHRMDARDRADKERKAAEALEREEQQRQLEAEAEKQRHEFRWAPHTPEQCIGPDYFPDHDDTAYWHDACGVQWEWRYGLQWEQTDMPPTVPD
jgi:hypothetical protein